MTVNNYIIFRFGQTDIWSWSQHLWEIVVVLCPSKQLPQLLWIICSSRFGSANTNIVSVAVRSFGELDQGSAVPWEWDHKRAWTLKLCVCARACLCENERESLSNCQWPFQTLWSNILQYMSSQFSWSFGHVLSIWPPAIRVHLPTQIKSRGNPCATVPHDSCAVYKMPLCL